MTTGNTTLLGLALPVDGELDGTWGDVVNDSITSLLDSAIAGTTTLSADADVTLTTTALAANQARQAIILWNPASGTTTRNITAPAQSKIYTVINASGGTQSIVFRGAGPTTGVTIVKGESAVVAWNGTDFIKVSNAGGSASFTNVTITGTTTLSGLTASTALALDASKNVVSVTNTGTGNNVLSASPTLTGTITAAAANFSGAVALGDAAADNITVNGTVTSNLIFTDNTYDIGASEATRPRNLFLAGNATVGGNIVLTGSLDLTNLEVTNIKAKDGTAGMQIADSTGVVSFTANPVLSGGTANGVAYLNGSKVLTTGSALTFDGTNLGIGTTSPGVKLEVSSSADIFRLRTSTARGSGNGYMSFYDPTGRKGYFGYGGGDDSFMIANELSAPMLFLTSGTTRLTIDTSGNLGLGVTPSAWASSFKAVQLNTQTALWSSGAGTFLSTNAYNDNANKYIGTGHAARYYQLTGAHIWETAPSGTAGNVISFTQAMTLDASGNLLVGTTSNTYNAKIVSEGVGDNVAADFYRPGTGVSSAIVTYCSNVGGTRALKSYIDTAGALISTSDARLKENVQTFDAGLDCVLGLNPVYFNWKGDVSTQAGFIAQEVEQVLPIAVREMQSNGLEDMRTLDKNVLFPVLVKAIQEQQALIQTLTARVAALESN